MIDWLSAVIIPFSVTAGVLLICRYFFLKKCGPQISYLSWLLLPASLIVPVVEVPNWFAAVSGGQSFQQFIVTNNTEPASELLVLMAFYTWLVGMFGLLSFWLIRHISLLAYQKSLQPIELEFLSLREPSLVAYQSSEVFSPMLVGLIKPKLLIPQDFDELFTKDQQVLILEHELCHYRRGDMVWNTIALALLALMWFHPLAWLAFSRFRRDQELSCDQVVLARKHTTCRINYSKALVVAAETAPPLAFAQLSFKEYGDKNVMFERINLIKNKPSGSKLISTLLLAGAVSLLSAMSHAGNEMKAVKADAIYPVERVEPIYPDKAVTKGLEGSVVLKFDVTSAGDVANVSVVKATPKKVFNKSAQIALKQWKYKSSASGSKNNLVQLDFLLDKTSKGKFKQVEQIAVVKHD